MQTESIASKINFFILGDVGNTFADIAYTNLIKIRTIYSFSLSLTNALPYVLHAL